GRLPELQWKAVCTASSWAYALLGGTALGRPGDPGGPATSLSDPDGSRAGDGLVGAHEVGALERAGVAAVDQPGAAVDVVDVQVPGTGRGQPACAVAVLGRHPAVVGGCARAVYHGAAARAGQRGVDAGDRARGDAAAEGHGVQVPREVGRVYREG